MKYIVIIAVVLLGLFLWTSAEAAVYAAKYPRAVLHAIVDRDGAQFPIHKIVDGGNTCYTFGLSISCVK